MKKVMSFLICSIIFLITVLPLLPSAALAGTCDGDGDAPDWDDQFDPRCNPPNSAKSLGGGTDSCSDSNANQCSIGQYSGNPINNSTGNKFQQETDYIGSGSNTLQLVRYYNSQSTIGNGPFGSHWNFNYSGRIQVVSSTQVNVIRSDEKTFSFKWINGVWQPDADVNSQLTAISGGGWVYTNGQDGTERYDAAGRLITVANRVGLRQTLNYDSTAKLTSVNDEFGRSLKFAYDNQGHISAIIDPADHTLSYAYDSRNNLTTVGHADGNSREYRYENASWPHALTGIIDENGTRFASWSYDNQGWATSSEHADGSEKVTLSYDRANLKTTVKDLLGANRLYSYRTYLGVAHTAFETQSCTNLSCSSATRSMSYDNEGNLVQSIDFNGNITNYNYDTVRNLEILRTEAVGKPQSRTIQTTWHSRFRLPAIITESGRTTTFKYDDRGNLLQKTVTDNATQQSRKWSYSYNDQSQPLTIDGPRNDVNDVTRLSYDAHGNLSTISDALGHVTTINNYNADGKPLSLKDANGLVSRFQYDPRGRLINSTIGAEVTRYSYDAADQLLKVTLPDSASIAYRYDNAHRLVGITDSLGNHIDYTLDNQGNRLNTQVFDPANQLISTRAQVFDGLSRLTKTIGAENQTASVGYDANGNTIRVIDPLNNKTVLAYDTLNRLISSIDPAGYATKNAYDKHDNLLSVTDPLTLVTDYVYDGLGQRLTSDSPDTGKSQTSYDDAGNPLSSVDARGQIVNYNYDALNRVTQISPAGQSPIKFRYDQGRNGIGHLTQMIDDAGVTNWAYDVNGRLTSKTIKTGSVTLVTRYGFNANGRLTTLTYPSGQVLKLNYNSNGQISGFDNKRTTLLSGIDYQPFGVAKNWTFGNGVKTSRDFDQDGRLIGYDLADRWRQLSYDSASRITGYIDADLNFDQSFSYDELGRLTGVTNPTSQTRYSYDANGNRTQQLDSALTKSFNLESSSNRLMSVTDDNLQTIKNYSYDTAGHLIDDGYNQFGYDGRGRLVQVSNVVLGVEQYRVNGLGQRVAKFHRKIPKRSGGDKGDVDDEDEHGDQHGKVKKSTQRILTSTYFVYDEAGHLIGEYDQQGQAIQETVWLGDMPVAVLKNYQTYYVYTDHLNSPRAITSQNGEVVWRWESDPFGMGLPKVGINQDQDQDDHHRNSQAIDEDPDHDGHPFIYNLRFPGQYYDKETGLHYNTHRDYDPSTGRYIESDPIGLLGGVNTYAYVGSDPLRYIDPRGLNPLLIRALAAAGAVALELYDLQLAGVEGVPGGGVGRVCGAAKSSESGGLNLFKWGKDTTAKAEGWRGGDFMLHLPDKGSPSANWAQNSGRLREEMGKGNPIYDSYRNPVTGERISTGGFLRAERNLLESRGWQYSPSTGAYHPRGN
ncbi:MAG: RHS repeat-associated core domain-containing protein [Methylococcaceae bacterium]|nr:RHS repeat-associated core domain-containing protein [Methylococcaceae bacterium]MDZ4155903.1 RHS repeat-associated core domain-containing protein [Methylococcales bacterium]MDP2392280.1 RHS repeat-associated core domain-containing protein [Methylococcaceae bacterium]MDP3019012.1 RHS repeat-associated core domain-containing protein [Methylococcaceae bacterium]MDP3391574.1 RHS repeat-associated core domain-containing protein [Methylococcaceae bacterium]